MGLPITVTIHGLLDPFGMSARATVSWDSLEHRTPTLFRLAGGLFVVFAILWGAGAYSTVTPRPAVDVFGPAGWAAAFLGLLGLYPRLATRTPWLARTGAAFVAVGTVGALVTTIVSLAELAAIVGEPPAWVAVLSLPIIVGIIPGFVAFAAATLRSRIESRTVGLLLLGPAILFAVNIVRVAMLGPTTPPWAPFVLGSGQAIALFSIGQSLRRDDEPTDRTQPVPGTNP